VLEVQPAAFAKRWTCHARNLAIAGGLDERITLQRATWTKDRHGAAVATWSDYRIGLRARLQPLEGAMGLEHERPATRVRYRVYLAEPVTVDEDHRIIRNGTVYTIVGYERPERIDELFVILAEGSGEG
jgi:SPP1 family predicted phage head-tail adaptor